MKAAAIIFSVILFVCAVAPIVEKRIVLKPSVVSLLKKK